MKTLKLIQYFILSMTLMCGCIAKVEGPYFHHYLLLGFQDSSGNDLIKGIGTNKGGPGDESLLFVKPDLYTLELEEAKCEDSVEPECVICDVDKPRLYFSLKSDESGDPLIFTFSMVSARTKKCSSPAETLIVNLKCPYIFGDDQIHEIVSYWEKKGNSSTNCYDVKMDGMKESFKTEVDHPDGVTKIDFFVIILEREK